MRPRALDMDLSDLKDFELISGHGYNQDRMLHAAMARLTHGLSSASVAAAAGDWLTHLVLSPGKQQQLGEKALRKLHRLMLYMAQCAHGSHPPCIEPLPQDVRFRHSDWQQYPFNVIYQAFLLLQQWWWNATTEVRGVTPHHEQVMTFVMRQMLDVFAPSNCPMTNPEVLRETFRTGGVNLLQGAANWWNDAVRLAAGQRPEGAEAFEPGRNVATTQGQVVFRNRLIELIQYRPTTALVHKEPVLIVPSWIMKYYILDLSPQNSLVRYLVGQGHTVFMISWKNPDAKDRDLGMQDYLHQGVLAARDVINAIVPKRGIHGVGYCLGGTLLAIAAAMLARDGDQSLRSVTLLATEVDFEEPGELSLFIDESQVTYLEDLMWDQGFLDGKQMAGAFTLLNSKDLVWSRVVHEYLMGQRRPLTDLMAWNADATRLPYRMHTEYLRDFYLDNKLAEGRYEIGGKPVALTDIKVPMFVVATVRDHVSPWRSVYRIHLLTDTQLTFLLTAGGHNAGVVSEPGHPNRSYQIATRQSHSNYLGPDAWKATASRAEGSWWPEWQRWLAARSSGRARPPTMGAPARGYAPLADAPGQYVLVP